MCIRDREHTNMAYQHVSDRYYLTVSTLDWCGLSYDSYCMNDDPTPQCGPDSKEYFPKTPDPEVEFQDQGELEEMRRTYQSDAQEFFRAALEASDGTMLDPVPFERLEETHQGRAAPKGVMSADDGAQMDFRRSLDCLTMFMVPAFRMTREEWLQQRSAWEEAGAENYPYDTHSVARVMYGKEDMRTQQLWLGTYIQRCNWLLEAYGYDPNRPVINPLSLIHI